MLSKIDFRQYLVIALSIAIFTTPLGVLSIKGWVGYHLFACAILSIILLWTNRDCIANVDISDRSKIRLMAWIFTLPFIATLVAQLLRGELNLSALDSPARFILAIPILYGLIATKINIARLVTFAIPISVIATYLLIPYLPQKGWAIDSNRLATYSVDPLTFGKIALGLGLMSAFIALENIHKKLILVIATIGLMLGIYMSIESQSRTGWLSVLFVILFFIFNFFRKTGPNSKKIIGSVMVSIVIAIPFLINPKVSTRITQAAHEISAWSANKNTVDTSVGMRLSFWKIGSQLLIEKPITGWGNEGFKQRLAGRDFEQLATQYTRDFTLTAGFHSDIMQNAVRSGIGGLIAYLSIFLIPLILFIKFYLKNQSSQLTCGLGIIYVCVELISSLSTEVLSLKSTTSFYGLMVAFLIAGAINAKTKTQKTI